MHMQADKQPACGVFTGAALRFYYALVGKQDMLLCRMTSGFYLTGPHHLSPRNHELETLPHKGPPHITVLLTGIASPYAASYTKEPTILCPP